MKIIIATGGSGGHIFPALHVASQLKTKGHDVHFVGVFDALKDKIISAGYQMDEIPSKGLLSKYPIAILRFLLSMIKAIKRSFQILKEVHPDAVLGFGGYGAFPVVFTAACLKYPTMIHEQNVYPGRANRLLSKIVNRVAISFEETQKYFPVSKTVLTGCPSYLRGKDYDRTEILKNFGLDTDKYTILVLGGSQGSHRINIIFQDVVSLLKDSLDFQFIHISGFKDYDALRDAYRQRTVSYYLSSFIDEIDRVYAVSDLAISRAGAVTVAELASFAVPTIFIPYPHAGGHQRANADVLADKGLATIIEDRVLTSEILKDVILLFKDRLREKSYDCPLTEGNQNAAECLAKEITELKK